MSRPFAKLAALLFIALLAALMYLRGRRPGLDPAVALYLQFNDILASKGVPRLPSEGPLAYADRVSESRPELAAEMHGITRQFMRVLYVAPSEERDTAVNADGTSRPAPVQGRQNTLRELRRRVQALRRVALTS